MYSESGAEWDLIRDAFDLDESYIHLSLGMLCPHPEPVRNSIARHREGFDRNPTLYYRNKDACENLVLNRAAAYLGADHRQIALTESTTLGLALVISGLVMEQGGEILTTVHEHYAASELVRFKARKDNVRIVRIALYEDSRHVVEQELVDRLLGGITPKTRLIVLTWVHSCSGVKLPIRTMCERIAQINAERDDHDRILVAVDGLHALGVEDFDVEDLGVDFFIAGCHKSLFGPRGTGIVWGSEAGWKRLVPIATSFKVEAFWPWYERKNPDDHCPKAWLCSPGGFQAYEHRWALAEAFDFQLSLGKKKVSERISTLNRYAKEGIQRIPNVRLYTPDAPSLSSGLLCFEVDGLDPSDVVEKLIDRKVITGQTPYQRSLNRFMPGILNDFKELDRALQALEEIAIATPAASALRQ